MKKIEFKDLPTMTTPVSSDNLNDLQDNVESAIIPTKLVSVSASEPTSPSIGDIYYNINDNKLYTYTVDNTWDAGVSPSLDSFYINLENESLYYYNGTSLVTIHMVDDGASGVDTLPIGIIIPYAGSSTSPYIPSDWLPCDGRAVSRTDYSDLYTIIGDTYGSGDGSLTFNLPNIENITVNVGDSTVNIGYWIKTFKSSGVSATVNNAKTTSTTDTYSCTYINNITDNIIANANIVRQSNSFSFNNTDIDQDTVYNFYITGSVIYDSTQEFNIHITFNNQSSFNVARVVITQNRGGTISSVANNDLAKPIFARAMTNGRFFINGQFIISDGYVQCNSQGCSAPGIPTSNFIQAIVWGMNNVSASNITKVTVSTSAGKFDAGSRCVITKQV